MKNHELEDKLFELNDGRSMSCILLFILESSDRLYVAY